MFKLMKFLRWVLRMTFLPPRSRRSPPCQIRAAVWGYFQQFAVDDQFQEKGRIKKCQEKSRDSMESSRTSLSSSFTSFSSIEHKSPQEEPIYVHRSFFSKSPRNSPRSPSDHTPQIHPSTLSSRTNRQKQEGIDTIFRKTRVLGRTNEELHAADEYATKIFQASGPLHKESEVLSMFDQINPANPTKFVEKSNPKKLHQKLISDAVNEILAEKIETFSSHGYKINCLLDCRETSLKENSMIHRKLLRHSQVWDSFKSEIPAIVLEIERLIFKDLINEVVNGETAGFSGSQAEVV